MASTQPAGARASTATTQLAAVPQDGRKELAALDELVAKYLQNRIFTSGSAKEKESVAEIVKVLIELGAHERKGLQTSGIASTTLAASATLTERLLLLKAGMGPRRYIEQYGLLRDWVHSCLDMFKARERKFASEILPELFRFFSLCQTARAVRRPAPLYDCSCIKINVQHIIVY